jgi:hypothetical protein
MRCPILARGLQSRKCRKSAVDVRVEVPLEETGVCDCTQKMVHQYLLVVAGCCDSTRSFILSTSIASPRLTPTVAFQAAYILSSNDRNRTTSKTNLAICD